MLCSACAPAASSAAVSTRRFPAVPALRAVFLRRFSDAATKAKHTSSPQPAKWFLKFCQFFRIFVDAPPVQVPAVPEFRVAQRALAATRACRFLTQSPELVQLVDIEFSRPVIAYTLHIRIRRQLRLWGRQLRIRVARSLAAFPHSSCSLYHKKFSTFDANMLSESRAEATSATILVSLVYIARPRTHPSIVLEEWAHLPRSPYHKRFFTLVANMLSRAEVAPTTTLVSRLHRPCPHAPLHSARVGPQACLPWRARRGVRIYAGFDPQERTLAAAGIFWRTTSVALSASSSRHSIGSSACRGRVRWRTAERLSPLRLMFGTCANVKLAPAKA
ncbi:hypothetical protein MVEN_01858500 [Mycena venus]|uniref:Uncharacterized protein n=1 Tax=Mycena venus TaxID=2733690 RepID=A0A8H7CM94_9AGAR|nr:hypothetical protein MVEN_01858500 [Mycena venus]